MVAHLLGQKKRAQQLADKLVRSKLYDKRSGLFNYGMTETGEVNERKTTYKNGLAGLMLALLQRDEFIHFQSSLLNLLDPATELYKKNFKQSAIFADNIMLGLAGVHAKSGVKNL